MPGAFRVGAFSRRVFRMGAFPGGIFSSGMSYTGTFSHGDIQHLCRKHRGTLGNRHWGT